MVEVQPYTSPQNVQLSTDNPLSANNPNHITMEMDTICNDGWDGIMDEGAMYDFSVYVRNIDCQKKKFNVALVNEHGIVLAEGDFTSEGQGWKQYKLSLNTDSKKRAKMVLVDAQKCQLRIIGKKKGRVALDMISLFPHDTFKGHGLRKDLAETIAALKPKFVRFPGGCMSHGEGIDNIYHWNHTVGPWQDRKPFVYHSRSRRSRTHDDLFAHEKYLGSRKERILPIKEFTQSLFIQHSEYRLYKRQNIPSRRVLSLRKSVSKGRQLAYGNQ